MRWEKLFHYFSSHRIAAQKYAGFFQSPITSVQLLRQRSRGLRDSSLRCLLCQSFCLDYPSPSHRFIKIHERQEEDSLGLGVGQLSIEETPLCIEDLYIARVAVVVAQTGSLGVVTEGNPPAALRCDLFPRFLLIDQRVIDFRNAVWIDCS